ncbi:uncharacterized protein LOC130702524 [Daphnia carinata]|uniref:uncharacterized protein LOC130702524 n=1 Tax=Daphnia carinata TaxID=120202 RepID=UPI00257B8B74|nr:uncharacterized protein LOC130702524 [Daphnia carinata]
MASHAKKKTVEPLLRFPFIHSLANPCGFALNSNSSFPTIQSWLTERHVNHYETTPAPLGNLRTLDLSGESTLAQQSLAFLIPFREVLSAPNGSRYSGVKYSSEDQRSLTEELKLVVTEAGHLIRRIYAPSGLHKCGGFQLQSLPQEDLIVSPTGQIQLEEVYRTLMIFSTHLHLMIRDAYESSRFCPSENYVRLQNMQQLTGKVETSMCLILHSALVTENCDNVNYFRVTRQILQSYVHRYYDCSAREIRRCLVFRYGDRILSLLERHVRS